MNPLLTYGYSGFPGGNALDDLKAWADAGAQVADVRLRPVSRNPRFGKVALAAALGTRYTHIANLGNLNYRTGGPIHLADEEGGLRILHRLLLAGPVVIVCACAEVTLCHRAVIARLATQRGIASTYRHLAHGERP